MAALSVSRRLFSSFTRSSDFPKNDPLSLKVKHALFDCHDLLSKPDTLQFLNNMPDAVGERMNRAMKQLLKYPFQELPNPVKRRWHFQHVDVIRNEEKNYTMIKLVMPGVGENGFKMWLDEDTKKVLHITGEEDREKGRKYEVQIKMNSLVLPYFPYFDQIKTDIKNGIVCIVAPLNKKLWI